MTVALDTSALLARHLEHPSRDVVERLLAIDHDWCASALALAEALAIAERLAGDPRSAEELREGLYRTWDAVAVVPVDAFCLQRASELTRQHPLRITDAIHLAAADRLPRPVRFVTFDPNQMPVAEALGFSVESLRERDVDDPQTERPPVR